MLFIVLGHFRWVYLAAKLLKFQFIKVYVISKVVPHHRCARFIDHTLLQTLILDAETIALKSCSKESFKLHVNFINLFSILL